MADTAAAVLEYSGPLRRVSVVTLGAAGGATQGIAPSNAHQRWVIDEIMLSTARGPVAELNGPFTGSAAVTTGGLPGATQPLTFELFLNETTSPGNSLGSSSTGIFTRRHIELKAPDRLVVKLFSDAAWSGVAVSIVVTGTWHQRRL